MTKKIKKIPLKKTTTQKRENSKKKEMQESSPDHTGSSQEESTPMEKIKQSFNEGVTLGRRSFLKKMLEIRGVQTEEIQKIYSSGLMDPEVLKDISLGDLVKATGVGVDFARKVKETFLRADSDLPFEYEKREVDRLKKETEKIRTETNKIRNEFEKANKQYDDLRQQYDTEHAKEDQLKKELAALRDEERKAYFNEKREQDEMLFFINEQQMYQQVLDGIAKQLEQSEKAMEAIKREFVFTKGECNHIKDKIQYLMNRLDTVLKIKGVSQEKLTSFLHELQRVHDTLAGAYKKASLGYYEKKVSLSELK